MPMNSVAEQPPTIDSRLSNLPPEREPQPAPPLRLFLGPQSEADDLRHMRAVLKFYIAKHGADVVLEAVRQLAGGGL